MHSLTALFDWVLTASLRASALTVVILGLQFVFRKQLGARTRYALWLPVLIVLLTPVLPQSRWSIENIFEQASPSVFSPQPFQTPTLTAPAPSLDISAPDLERIEWPKFRPLAWLSISAILLLLSHLSFIRTLRRFQRTRIALSEEWPAQICQMAREMGLNRAPEVWCSSAITSPAVTGLWKPVLLLPADFENAFTAPEARLMVQHELMHLKRHDLPLNALLCLLMALHWFNPLLWLAFLRVRADREVACDAQVLENALPQHRIEYGHALLKAETIFAPQQFSLSFVGLFRRGAALRFRIQSIANDIPPHPAMKLITLASISLLTFLGITQAEEPSNVIGKADFRPGDSIRITNVQRGDDFLTVTAEYELASEPEATISLHVTQTKGDGKSKTEPSQFKHILKGKGTVTLHHPHAREGMPHVSFYPAKGGSVFGGVYFGTAAEAAASQKMSFSMTTGGQAKASPLETKLRSIILPQVAFTDATVDQAVSYLRAKSRDHDKSTTEPKGVTIILRADDKPARSITLDRQDVSLWEALHYVAELAGMEMRVEPFAVVLAPAGMHLSAATTSGPAHPIILSMVDFKGATLDEALQFIRMKARELDPAKKGVNIVKKPGGPDGAKITISLRNVPINEALHYVASLSGHQLVIEGNTFILRPAK